MARTNPTLASEFRDSNLPTAIFDSLESALNAKVNLRPDYSGHEELFQRVKPLIGRLHIGQALLSRKRRLHAVGLYRSRSIRISPSLLSLTGSNRSIEISDSSSTNRKTPRI